MLCPNVIDSDHVHHVRNRPEAMTWIKVDNNYHVCMGRCPAQARRQYLVSVNDQMVCGYHSMCTHTLEDCNCKYGLFH